MNSASSRERIWQWFGILAKIRRNSGSFSILRIFCLRLSQQAPAGQ
jgi:hypothetical protein